MKFFIRSRSFFCAFVFASVSMMVLAGYSEARIRHVKRIGVYAGGNSYSAYGVNLGYNLVDEVRVHAGVDFSTTPKISYSGLDFGGLYFFDAKNFAPAVGLNFMGTSGYAMYALGGMDWANDNGLNVGLQASVPFSSHISLGFIWYLGWYFGP